MTVIDGSITHFKTLVTQSNMIILKEELHGDYLVINIQKYDDILK